MNNQAETCKKCGYPLILKKDDNPSDPLFDLSHYEDDNNGYCHNCKEEQEKNPRQN